MINKKNRITLSGFILAILFFSCDSKPKVIEAVEEESSVNEISANSIPAFKDVEKTNNLPISNNASAEHEVIVEEVLNTERYSYLYVTENGEKFWVAISKREVNIGDTYLYQGGLVKKNFYSQEHDRTFETVYLVSNIRKKGEVASSSTTPHNHAPTLEVGDIKPAPGAIQLAELFTNKQKYQGKVVKVTGKVIKVNPMIMQRNWIHLKDNSGKDYDLTITTTENVPLGAVLSMEGTIALDKDFGAGYRFDVIMEGAVLR